MQERWSGTTSTASSETKGDQWPNSLKMRYVTDPKNLTAESPALQNARVSACGKCAKHRNSQSIEEESQVRVKLAPLCVLDVVVDPSQEG